MQVAGSASGTHKHDGDNTTECLQIIFVDVEFAQCVSCRQRGMVPKRFFFQAKYILNCQDGINIYIHREKLSYIYRGIYTMKLAWLLKQKIQKKRRNKSILFL